MNKVFCALVISILLTSCLSTGGSNSPILIGKNRVVNFPTEYYDNSSTVTIIYDDKNMAYIPKFELSTYDQNFISQSINYHSQQYHLSKSELRKLEQESIYLEEELESGNIGKEKYNQRTREIDEEKGKLRIEMDKYDQGYIRWSKTESQGDNGGIPQVFYKIRIAAEENVKNICTYSDDFEYKNIEFKKSGSAYVVYIYPYSSQEADLLIEEFKSSGKYRDAVKIEME